MKICGFYESGTMWNRPGYYIAIGETADALFFFGDLKTAKAAACDRFQVAPAMVTWKRW